MTAVGLTVLGAFYGLASLFGEDGSSRMVARASGLFVALWLAVSLVDFYLGIDEAGFSVASETASHAMIFGLPAAAALYLAIRAARRDPARPA